MMKARCRAMNLSSSVEAIWPPWPVMNEQALCLDATVPPSSLWIPNENDKKRQSLPECHAIDGLNGQA
jgi:hypothetical protein